jgi:hypothetical protein
MRTRPIGFLAVAVVMSGLGLAREAAAHQVKVNPFGNATTTAAIGNRVGLGAGVLWRRVSDHMCAWTSLGPGSMNDDYTIQAGDGNNTITVASSGVEVHCNSLQGESMIFVGVLSTGGHFLDIDLQGGTDFAHNAAFVDSFLFGGSGADILITFRGDGLVTGGSGNDKIHSLSSGTSEVLLGETDVDCLADDNASAATFDCGPEGNDSKATGKFPVNSATCENIVSSC